MADVKCTCGGLGFGQHHTSCNTVSCTTCGHGTRRPVADWQGRRTCDYCGDDFPEGTHRHKLGIKVDGLQKCVGRKYLGCDYEEYDSQWGAGVFSDWPVGHHKPYGA